MWIVSMETNLDIMGCLVHIKFDQLIYYISYYAFKHFKNKVFVQQTIYYIHLRRKIN